MHKEITGYEILKQLAEQVRLLADLEEGLVSLTDIASPFEEVDTLTYSKLIKDQSWSLSQWEKSMKEQESKAVKILYEQYLKEKETLRQLLNILYVKPNL
jgi:hypothetical protein